MAEAKTAVAHKPVWTDLSTSDAEGARKFYSAVFGWKVEVNPDPQYGGYALAKVHGKDVAGIGPKQMDEAPTAWTVYIGTANAAETAKKAEAAGAKIIAPSMFALSGWRPSHRFRRWPCGHLSSLHHSPPSTPGSGSPTHCRPAHRRRSGAISSSAPMTCSGG